MGWVARLFNEHLLVRRLTLVWACWLITVVVLRVTEPAVLEKITASVASVVAAVIGILATVIAFYQHHRSKSNVEPD
jgi:hypothetical protein